MMWQWDLKSEIVQFKDTEINYYYIQNLGIEILNFVVHPSRSLLKIPGFTSLLYFPILYAGRVWLFDFIYTPKLPLNSI